jgi:hypothetical protein
MDVANTRIKVGGRSLYSAIRNQNKIKQYLVT